MKILKNITSFVIPLIMILSLTGCLGGLGGNFGLGQNMGIPEGDEIVNLETDIADLDLPDTNSNGAVSEDEMNNDNNGDVEDGPYSMTVPPPKEDCDGQEQPQMMMYRSSQGTLRQAVARFNPHAPLNVNSIHSLNHDNNDDDDEIVIVVCEENDEGVAEYRPLTRDELMQLDVVARFDGENDVEYELEYTDRDTFKVDREFLTEDTGVTVQLEDFSVSNVPNIVSKKKVTARPVKSIPKL